MSDLPATKNMDWLPVTTQVGFHTNGNGGIDKKKDGMEEKMWKEWSSQSGQFAKKLILLLDRINGNTRTYTHLISVILLALNSIYFVLD